MKALILAGGKATRLYPITLYMPKQLIMLNGYPMIYYVLDHCKRNDIVDLILCINPMHKKHFFNALGNGSYFDLNIQFSIAPEDLGTAGRVLYANKFLRGEDNFLVYYGDIITHFNLKSMIQSHMDKVADDNRICTLAMSNMFPMGFGSGLRDKHGKILSFKEKPRISEISNFYVNLGIGVYNSFIFKYCTAEADLAKDVIPLAIERGENVYSFVVKKPFYDIGTFSSIDKVSRNIKQKPLSLRATK